MLIVSLVLIQVIIFTALIFLFRKIMTENVTIATKHLDEMNMDYQKKEEELSRRLEEADRKSHELIAKSQDEADKQVAESVKTAQTEREKIVAQARAQADAIVQQAEKSRQMLLGELNQRIEREAMSRAFDLVHDVLPDSLKKTVHDRWVDDLISGGFETPERLNIPDDVHEAVIATSYALDPDQKTRLQKKLKEAFKREIAIREQIDPKTIAGIIVTLGSLVLDGSLMNKIQRKERPNG